MTIMKRLLLTALCLTFLSAPLAADHEERSTRPSVHKDTDLSASATYRPHNVLSPQGLERIIRLAKEVSFKDDRMRLLEAALTERPVTADQCVRLMKLADFDDERLEIIRCVNGNLVDPENIPDILNELNFKSNRDKAWEILSPRR